MNKYLVWFAGALSVWIIGCGDAVKEKSIEVKASPTAVIQQTLQRYADGGSLSSEVTTFPDLVNDMKKVDAAKGGILEKGLAEIQKNPSKAKSTAQDLLKQLGLESKDAGKDSKDAKSK